MHYRCSLETLFARYHTGLRAIPRRWIGPLLMPPHGQTILALDSSGVVGFAQLIHAGGDPRSGEVSVLVEDEWQRCGIGAELVSMVSDLAGEWGMQEIFGLSLPRERGFERAAARAGLYSSTECNKGFRCVRIELDSSRTEATSRLAGATPAALKRCSAGPHSTTTQVGFFADVICRIGALVGAYWR